MESDSDDTCSSEKSPPKRVKKSRKKIQGPAKKRRTTYDIRKQQKSDLLAEMANLQRELNLLKHRVLIEQGVDATIQRTEAANCVLRESSQQQHVTIAGVQAMLVTHLQQSLLTSQPTQMVIRLGTDREERRNTMLNIKDRKLREAKHFITAWGRGLDTSSTFSQENQFEPLDGGFSVVRFDNAPICGTTVRAVFDAIIHAMQNTEIMISDLFGSITIREDSDFNASDMFQLRLVSSTSHGAVVESNSAIFSEYVDGPDGGYGIIAADFVDSDELYPYRSDERVRRDTITVVSIRSVPYANRNSSEKQEAVVGTRWTCLKLAHSKLDIPKDGLRELQEVSMAWGDTIKKCIMQYIAKSKE